MTRRHAAYAASAFSVGLLSIAVATGDAPGPPLLDALRRDDVTAVRIALKAGASPNTRDGIGATPVMVAAAFSSPASLRAVIDAGGDVNAASGAGATALMWAAGDVVKLRLLLDRGATVNARTRAGETALLTAARRGNRAAVDLLVSRGADAADAPGDRAVLLTLPSPRPSTVPTLANYPVSNVDAVRALVDRGADPNPPGRFPMLGLAVFQGQRRTAEVLLEYGADPNARGQQDATPLMMAAGAPHPDESIVRLLLEYGADLNARDKAGRTPLDWALRQGETGVATILRGSGAVRGTQPSPPPAAVANPRMPRGAIAAALSPLQSGGAVLYERRKCISCHQQTLPVMAIQRASGRGITIDRRVQSRLIQSIVDTWTGRREDLMLGHEVAGGANELTYGLTAFAEAGVPAGVATDAAVVNLLSLQRDDGSWVFYDTRPPQADNGPIAFTAMAIRGLTAYAPPGLAREVNASVVRALSYLRSAPSASTQDDVFKVAGLVWGRAGRAEIAARASQLAALQREDGGWAQLKTMAPDAYATGEALYVLGLSGVPPGDRVFQRGVAFLLRTQLEDGTWFVRSRAFGFQPYFETGFPHGPDQFISASATAWATIALSFAAN